MSVKTTLPLLFLRDQTWNIEKLCNIEYDDKNDKYNVIINYEAVLKNKMDIIFSYIKKVLYVKVNKNIIKDNIYFEILLYVNNDNEIIDPDFYSFKSDINIYKTVVRSVDINFDIAKKLFELFK